MHRPFVVALILSLAGCGTVYLDPADRIGEVAYERTVELPMGSERAYRHLYARLRDCLRHAPYRVRGEFDLETGRGSLVADQGVGFERVLFLAPRRALWIEVTPSAGDGTRLAIFAREARLEPYARAVPRWLAEGYPECQA
jgi:predicted small lipoprotein YifL